jgi:hypothetical protein
MSLLVQVAWVEFSRTCKDKDKLMHFEDVALRLGISPDRFTRAIVSACQKEPRTNRWRFTYHAIQVVTEHIEKGSYAPVIEVSIPRPPPEWDRAKYRIACVIESVSGREIVLDEHADPQDADKCILTVRFGDAISESRAVDRRIAFQRALLAAQREECLENERLIADLSAKRKRSQ